jgi:hypothetical protein
MFSYNRRALLAGIVAAAALAASVRAQEPPVTDPSKTVYGARSPRAPRELDVFAFLIGSWEGTGRTRRPDGTFAEYPVTWIGRYILDGTAIADEGHGPYPDGTPFVGISFRQYDRSRKAWIIEFLNIPDSFLRRQVRHGTGGVAVRGRTVTVSSGASGVLVREHYAVPDADHWTYRLDSSTNGGRSWDEGSVEITLHRSH